MDSYLIGIKRFVNGNLKDSFKMKCLNLIIGNNIDQNYGNLYKNILYFLLYCPIKLDLCLPEDVNKDLIKRQNEYLKIIKLNIQIVTWNVMAIVPNC